VIGLLKCLKNIGKLTNCCQFQSFENAIIKCAWCGGIIIPGDPITLHFPREGFRNPEYVVIFEEKLVCCFRKRCRNGHNIDGYWVNPGNVETAFFTLQ